MAARDGMIVDKEKTYKTGEGRETRIYATDGAGDYPVHGATLYDDGWVVSYWTSEGRYSIQSHLVGPRDLVEVKPRIVREHGWCNIYRSSTVGGHETKEIADMHACPGRIACVLLTIDCEHGEGL